MAHTHGHQEPVLRSHRWRTAAGLADARYSSSTWTFAEPADRHWWGDLWAERTEGWRGWAAEAGRRVRRVHGELLARSPRA